MPDEQGLAPETQGGGEGLAPGAEQQPVVDEWADLPPLSDGDMFPRSAVEELRDREAKYRIRARDLNTKVTEWGGEDAVAEAMRVHNLMQTDDGVTALFVAAGEALGLSPSQLETLFGEEQLTPEQQQERDAELDTPITQRDAQKMVEEALAKQVLEPQAEREAVEQRRVANDTIQSEFQALQVEDPEDMALILKAGERHIADGDFDPAHIRAAVRKGHADFQAAMQRQAGAYLQQKQTDANGVPLPVGGGSPGGEAPSEPANLDEAKALIRRQIATGTGAFS